MKCVSQGKRKYYKVLRSTFIGGIICFLIALITLSLVAWQEGFKAGTIGASVDQKLLPPESEDTLEPQEDSSVFSTEPQEIESNEYF